MANSEAPILNVNNLACLGDNELDWNDVSLANSYDLYRDDDSAFNYPVKVYNGLISYTIASHSTTAYYRVKACNGGGCSGYSNQVTGIYINGCQ